MDYTPDDQLSWHTSENSQNNVGGSQYKQNTSVLPIVFTLFFALLVILLWRKQVKVGRV